MFALERPWVLVFLALVPLFIIVRKYGRRGLLPPLGLGDSGGRLPPAAPLAYAIAGRARNLFAGLGFVLAVAAASGPTVVTRTLLYLNRGNEVMLAVDVSPSMAAADFRPDRLSAARAIIKGFLATRRNEAVGLVAFGGEAALLCPPTLDYQAILRRLDALEPGMLGEGTAIGSGIAVAAAHGLSAASASEGNQVPARARERHIIVLTDGENNAGALSPVSAASLASDAGFIISVVGVGSRGEVPLEYKDPETGTKRSGLYVSGFDRAGLEAIAKAGGGSFFDAEDGAALTAAFAKISDRSLSLSRTRSLTSESSLLPFFMLLAFLALTLARLLGLASGTELT